MAVERTYKTIDMEIIKQWIVKTHHLVLLSNGSYMISYNLIGGLSYVDISDDEALELIK